MNKHYDHWLECDKSFEIYDCLQDQEVYWVKTKDTIFYVEGGGMERDTGTINDVEVEDIYYENGFYYHKTRVPLTGMAHMKVDVEDLDVDFLAFSAHKMCGPTGVGVLYGKKELLEHLEPPILGGGMNESFDSPSEIYLKELPTRLEAGTRNIAGVIGFGETIKYLNKIGMERIHNYETDLRKYLIDKLLPLKHIDIINIESDSGIITFNVANVFSQDVAYYLNKYNVCVRAGNHCAKILKSSVGVNNTVRISLYFYNTYEEIDNLVELLSNYDKIVKEMI